MLHGLLDSLKESFEDESDITRRWNIGSSSCNSLPLCAALDPRFKHIKFIEDDDKRIVKQELLRLMEMDGITEQDDNDDDDVSKPKQKETALDILLSPENEELTAPITKDKLKQFVRTTNLPKELSIRLVESEWSCIIFLICHLLPDQDLIQEE